ncbi:Rgg family transcriptional regulator [Lactococcus lactis]|uniref:Rgg family transcriptional regulator n=1 Tax=Lactococcus lactis TaxID=1358 RepID=UPI00223B17BE|nr:hypothetical protein [Lactococcus lactis]
MERLNVTVEEYFEIYNYYYYDNFSLYQFFVDLKESYYKSDIRILLKMLNSLNIKSHCYKKLSPSTNNFLRLSVESYIFRLSNTLPKDYKIRIEQLYNYLERVTIWGFFEIFLASSCAYLFNEKQLEKIGDKILPNISIYKNSSFIYEIALTMLHNMIYAALKNNFLSTASLFLQYANGLEMTERLLPKKACLNYDKGYYLALIGLKDEGLKLMRQVYDFFILIDEKNYTQKMEIDISVLEKEN